MKPSHICVEHKLSVIEHPKPHGQSYNKWLGDRAKPSNRNLLRAAIDEALAKKPKDFNAFLSLMESSGYLYKHGKNPSFLHEGQRNIRLTSLGDSYSETELRAVISGVKTHTPRRKLPRMEAKPTLLSNIEAKLNSGRGQGYEQWANVFCSELLIEDELIAECIADDMDYFQMCSTVGFKPQLVTFKLYGMMQRGYPISLPENPNSNFLRK